MELLSWKVYPYEFRFLAPEDDFVSLLQIVI
jgi:hypothetical protein